MRSYAVWRAIFFLPASRSDFANLSSARAAAARDAGLDECLVTSISVANASGRRSAAHVAGLAGEYAAIRSACAFKRAIVARFGPDLRPAPGRFPPQPSRDFAFAILKSCLSPKKKICACPRNRLEYPNEIRDLAPPPCLPWGRSPLVFVRAVELIPFGQGFKDMAPAVDALERLVIDAKLRHGGQPVLTWCALNAKTISDAAGNRKLDKQKSTGRIDGAVALAMALGLATRRGGMAAWEPLCEMI